MLMKPRTAMVLALILTAFTFSSLAGDLSYKVTAAGFSNYMWRGIKFSKKPVIQNSVAMTYKDYTLTVWSNYDFDQERINEIDFYATYAHTFGKVYVEAAWNHFGLYDLHDSDELYLTLGLVNALNPTITTYVDVNYGKGAYIQGSLSHTFTLPRNLTFTLLGKGGFVINDKYMGLNDEGKEFVNLYCGEFDGTLSIPMGKHARLEPTIGYSFPLSDEGKQAIKNASYPASKQHFLFGGATLTFSF